MRVLPRVPCRILITRAMLFTVASCRQTLPPLSDRVLHLQAGMAVPGEDFDLVAIVDLVDFSTTKQILQSMQLLQLLQLAQLNKRVII